MAEPRKIITSTKMLKYKSCSNREKKLFLSGAGPESRSISLPEKNKHLSFISDIQHQLITASFLVVLVGI